MHKNHSLPDRDLGRAIAVTAALMCVEFLGGLWSNSLALISDALHMGTDLAALGIAWGTVRLARLPRDHRMSYGFLKAEAMAGAVSGIAVWALTATLVVEAVKRFLNPEPVKSGAMIVIAIFGLLANFASLWFLHRHRDHSINLRGAYVHVFADLLGSVGAVAAGIGVWITGWNPLDPLVTLLFAGLMIFSSWGLIWEALGILLDRAPRRVSMQKVKEDLSNISGVLGVHDLHVWSLSSAIAALSAHLEVGPGANRDEILMKTQEVLKGRHGIGHSTVQIESASAQCRTCEDGSVVGGDGALETGVIETGHNCDHPGKDD